MTLHVGLTRREDSLHHIRPVDPLPSARNIGMQPPPRPHHGHPVTENRRTGTKESGVVRVALRKRGCVDRREVDSSCVRAALGKPIDDIG